MFTEFLKANVWDFVDIEASEGTDGEQTDSNDDGMLLRPKIVLMSILYHKERMALLTTTTTAAARRTWNQKKTMLIVRVWKHRFILYDDTYDSAVDHAVPSVFSNANRGSGLDPSAAGASNDSMPLDYRLEEVINRYGGQISQTRDEIEDGSPNDFWNENITSIADGVTRRPIINDPPLWRVRVRVSISLIELLFGG